MKTDILKIMRGYLELVENAKLSEDADWKRQRLEDAALYAQCAQAEALIRIAAAIEELAKCVDPEVAFLWIREMRDKSEGK